MEISRSGQGAHAWVFFTSRVSARDVRRLGTAIISHTCTRTRQLKLESYDRLFPNQDKMPKGGFGNLIALPLQKGPREQGFSVFVDADLRPYPDQWAFLASIQPMAAHDIEPTIHRATGGEHPLDLTLIDDEDLATPWKRENTSAKKLAGPMAKSLTVTLANLIYFEKAELPQVLSNRLIRLAAFQNPEFYKAQAMWMPVWDKPPLSAVRRTTRSTSPYLAVDSMPRWIYCGTTISPVTCVMSVSAASLSTFLLSEICGSTRKPLLPACCVMTLGCFARRQPSARRSPPRP
jgi:hypothetical protein